MIEAAMYGSIAPWVLAILSSVWAYPAVLEEVVKWGILRYIVHGTQYIVRVGLIVGLAFGVGELGLYSTNAWSSGEWESMLVRLILTVPMHGLTGGIIGAALAKRLGLLGLGVAMILHYFYNTYIVTVFGP